MLHRRAIVRKLGWMCLVLLVGILSAEAALQLRARLIGSSPLSQSIPDEKIGWRPNPDFPGHDSRGWPNAAALEHADIVVLGDSLVYGTAWPKQVGAHLHQTVYQMAAYGYGPPQFALLFDEVSALRPKIIVTTFDDADDLYDSYKFMYRIGRFKRSSAGTPLDASLDEADVNMHETLTRAETIDPEFLRQKFLDCRNPVDVPDPRLQTVHHILDAPPLAPLNDDGTWRRGVLFLMSQSAVATLIRRRVFPTAGARPTGEQVWPHLCPSYRDAQLATLFNPAYRILALDHTDPRIMEGERLALQAFRFMARRCTQPQCFLYVLMIPTKETAFRRRVEPFLRQHTFMVDLWNDEGRVRANAMAFFEREHIATIDMLPVLEKLIASGVNPFAKDADGHPAQAGYDAFADAVVERLRQDGIKERTNASKAGWTSQAEGHV
ncbi:MAG TPA: hypothetical protein VJ746_15020 [Nitrospira sp.]|nr:hypothetical protein [Nitrospira sp.]